MVRKLKRFFLVVSLVLLVILIASLTGNLFFQSFYPFPQKVDFGVTFSLKYATYLGFDWKEIYIRILDELGVRRLRIPSYWDQTEPEAQKYDFSKIDFMLREGEKRGAKIILVLGARQPRWPECHIPNWAKHLSLANRQQNILQFIEAVVIRYKDNPAISAWQVENEPLLRFFGRGCDTPDASFLREEVETVRKKTIKPIIVTDSGELGLWITPMKISDIFGTTLYRQTFNRFYGYSSYPSLPYFYNLKSALVKSFFAPKNQKTIIVELQAEPWVSNGVKNVPIEQQTALFSEKEFKQNINFAKSTGFDEIYFWGVEWWFWIEKQGNSSYLDYAKTLFNLLQ